MKRSSRDVIFNLLALLIRGLYRLFGGLRVVGLEHLPMDGPAILAPNHRSWADPPAIRISVAGRCWVMANDFLFRIPVLGTLIRFFGGFPVRRGVLDKEAIRSAEAHLDAGDLVCVFPEGGTTITGTLYPFEGGVALIAIRKNVPIVPVAIVGADRMLPQNSFIPRYTRGGITVTFGRPIHPSVIDGALSRRERIDQLTHVLYESVASMLPTEYVPTEYQFLCGHPELVGLLHTSKGTTSPATDIEATPRASKR